MVRVEFRFKNAALYNALWDRFGDAAKQLRGNKRGPVSVVPLAAEVIGINPGTLNGLLRLEVNPWITGGKQPMRGPQSPRRLNPNGIKICEFLERGHIELFPPEIYEVKMPKVSGEIEVTTFVALSRKMEDPNQLAAVERQFTNMARRKLIDDAMVHRLTPREERVVKLSFGLDDDPLTFVEIAKREGMSKGRVGQIYLKALQGLRHPMVFKKLRAAL